MTFTCRLKHRCKIKLLSFILVYNQNNQYLYLFIHVFSVASLLGTVSPPQQSNDALGRLRRDAGSVILKMVVTHCCHTTVDFLSTSVKLITRDPEGLSFQLYALPLLFLGWSTGSPNCNLSGTSGVWNLRRCCGFVEPAWWRFKDEQWWAVTYEQISQTWISMQYHVETLQLEQEVSLYIQFHRD